MPHVSNNNPKKKISKNIYKHLVKTIVGLQGENDGRIFLSELLTPTEQVMLAKRLAILFMLAQSISSYKIGKILKVSTSTVNRLRISSKKGKYHHVGSLFKDKKNKERFWLEIESLIRFGMPSMGKRRWDWLDELYRNKDSLKQ